MQKTVTLTELKQSLGEVVNQAAYGQERIVLLARGKPKAALISIEDLEKLCVWEQKIEMDEKEAQLALLERMAWRRKQLAFVADNAEALRDVREERVDEIVDLS